MVRDSSGIRLILENILAKTLGPRNPRLACVLLRLVEMPMPTGSKDPDVLLDWILNSMGLVRRKKDVDGEQFRSSAIHRIFREVLLTDPLRGWDSKEIGDFTGISNTGIHHQIVKLRSCGLVTKQVEGKWHRLILRGGSMSAAVQLAKSQAVAVLEMRLKELSEVVQNSESRMSTESEDTEPHSR